MYYQWNNYGFHALSMDLLTFVHKNQPWDPYISCSRQAPSCVTSQTICEHIRASRIHLSATKGPSLEAHSSRLGPGVPLVPSSSLPRRVGRSHSSGGEIYVRPPPNAKSWWSMVDPKIWNLTLVKGWNLDSRRYPWFDSLLKSTHGMY